MDPPEQAEPFLPPRRSPRPLPRPSRRRTGPRSCRRSSRSAAGGAPRSSPRRTSTPARRGAVALSAAAPSSCPEQDLGARRRGVLRPPGEPHWSGEGRLARLRLEKLITPVTLLVRVLAACAPEGPGGGGGAAFDSIYVGTAWVTEGPRFCGDSSGELIEVMVSHPDGDFGGLCWSGRDPVECLSSSSGRITGESFSLRYTHGNCIYRLDGRRR